MTPRLTVYSGLSGMYRYVYSLCQMDCSNVEVGGYVLRGRGRRRQW